MLCFSLPCLLLQNNPLICTQWMFIAATFTYTSVTLSAGNLVEIFGFVHKRYSWALEKTFLGICWKDGVERFINLYSSVWEVVMNLADFCYKWGWNPVRKYLPKGRWVFMCHVKLVNINRKMSQTLGTFQLCFAERSFCRQIYLANQAGLFFR